MERRIILSAILMLLGFVFIMSSCRKKERGVCYCTFYSGDRTHYDLKDLPLQQQIDSCRQLSAQASHFAGSCKLKK